MSTIVLTHSVTPRAIINGLCLKLPKTEQLLTYIKDAPFGIFTLVKNLIQEIRGPYYQVTLRRIEGVQIYIYSTMLNQDLVEMCKDHVLVHLPIMPLYLGYMGFSFNDNVKCIFTCTLFNDLVNDVAPTLVSDHESCGELRERRIEYPIACYHTQQVRIQYDKDNPVSSIPIGIVHPQFQIAVIFSIPGHPEPIQYHPFKTMRLLLDNIDRTSSTQPIDLLYFDKVLNNLSVPKQNVYTFTFDHRIPRLNDAREHPANINAIQRALSRPFTDLALDGTLNLSRINDVTLNIEWDPVGATELDVYVSFCYFNVLLTSNDNMVIQYAS